MHARVAKTARRPVLMAYLRGLELASGVALFLQNRQHVLISDMDLSDHDLEQIAEADRRAVDPPIQVEMATWARAGSIGG